MQTTAPTENLPFSFGKNVIDRTKWLCFIPFLRVRKEENCNEFATNLKCHEIISLNQRWPLWALSTENTHKHTEYRFNCIWCWMPSVALSTVVATGSLPHYENPSIGMCMRKREKNIRFFFWQEHANRYSLSDRRDWDVLNDIPQSDEHTSGFMSSLDLIWLNRKENFIRIENWEGKNIWDEIREYAEKI